LLLFEARIEAHRDLKLAIAFCLPPRFDEDAAEVRVGFGVRWIDRDGPAVGGGGLVESLELVRGATLVALAASGQVERMTEFWDTATWLRQLGFLPTPSG
jgi:hypothetical protein